MNKIPLKKKEIINFFRKQKKIILESELVDLENARERFLFLDLKSKINLPPFNNSAVDGYALLKNDLNKKKFFIVIGELLQEIIKILKLNQVKL